MSIVQPQRRLAPPGEFDEKAFRLGIRDIVSLEGALAFFFFVGAFKTEGTEGFVFSLTDPTVVSWVLVTVMAAGRLATRAGAPLVYQAKYLLVHLFAAGIIGASSIFLGGAEEKFYLYFAFNLYSIVIGIFLVDSREKVWRFGKACMLVAFVAILFSLFDFASNRVTERALLGAEGYQWVSRAAFMSATIAAGMFVYDHRTRRRVVYFLIAILGLYTLLLSGGRQGVLALAIGLVMIALTAARGRVRARIFAGAVVLSVAIGAAYFLIASDIVPIWSLPRGVQRIWLTVTGGYENSRLPLYLEGLRIWFENPVIGAGWGRFAAESTLIYYRHPHNVFIEVLSELGLVGAAVFAFIFGWPMVRSIGALVAGKDQILSIMFATTIGLLGAILTSGDIVGNRLFFFLLVMLLHLTFRRAVIFRPGAPSAAIRPTPS
ncbi:O-antigen ligase family protein [Brevundimonas sp.]|uniref:O-antigen ligase family protein n=1 Tax=Brevundimonas sp. TaxID=1871086 RepID=UPI002D2C265B|nr:O-antigen ligase family protein [Brevundimonas sp.]HYC67398.1 O-antigen ligase family protein [Brevundimonas sp.]